MDDILLFEMIVSRNGELGFQSISSESKLLEYGKTFGWWSRADDCFGQFHNVTGSNIGNWLFGAAANALTLGGYSVGAAVICAGVALSSDEKFN